jgi:hypothetical protein
VKQKIIEGGPLQAQSHELALQLAHRSPRGRKEAIHVMAIALGAWHTTGGGVGLGEQATLLKGTHGRADRGGAGLQAKALHERFAAHRFGGVHVVTHGGLQHLLLPAGQWLHGIGACVGGAGIVGAMWALQGAQ